MKNIILIIGATTIVLVSGIIILSMNNAEPIVELEVTEEVAIEVVDEVVEETNQQARGGNGAAAGNGGNRQGNGGNRQGNGGNRQGGGGNGPGAGGNGERGANGAGAGDNRQAGGGNRQGGGGNRPAFSTLDTDGNGTISTEEIEASAGTRPNFVANTLERFDANGDQMISEEEFSVNLGGGGRNQ